MPSWRLFGGEASYPEFIPNLWDQRTTMKTVYIHLISDATGETIRSLSRACLAQFDNIKPIPHEWTMVRDVKQLQTVIEGIRENPGIVLYTLVDRAIQDTLEAACEKLRIPCVSVLDPALEAMHAYIGGTIRARPGRQHEMDADYFARIDAVQFAMQNDDGQSVEGLIQADVILAGVSRTLKTPTCIYLANRGIKAASIPIYPGTSVPEEILAEGAPLVVGLTKDARRLVQIRRSRLKLLDRDDEGDYTDIAAVSEEIKYARKVFADHNWPVIDVSQRSVEEVAAIIMKLYEEYREATR